MRGRSGFFEETRESISWILSFVNSKLVSTRFRSGYGTNLARTNSKTAPFTKIVKGCGTRLEEIAATGQRIRTDIDQRLEAELMRFYRFARCLLYASY